MFVPRALRLKGVQEPQKSKPQKPTQKGKFPTSDQDALDEAIKKKRTASHVPQIEQDDTKLATPGPRFITTPVSPEYVAQLAAGVELIFSDYAHQHPESSEWLQERYRNVDAGEKCKSYFMNMSTTVNLLPSHPPYRHS